MTKHLVNVSGGKDSTATYLLAIESGRPFRAVFADTGNEHPLTYEYVRRLAERTGGPEVEWVRADFARELATHRDFILLNWTQKLCEGRPAFWRWHPRKGVKVKRPDPPTIPGGRAGATVKMDGGSWKWIAAIAPLPFVTAEEITTAAAAMCVPNGNPYLELCILKGRFPSSRSQFCTEELKVLPITEQIVLPMLKHGRLLQWLGIRAEESDRRALQPRFNRTDTGAYLWRPLLDWSEERVWKQHARHGVAPNPLYALGFTRVGCYPCVNCRKHEVKLIGELSPEHIERVREWERIVGILSLRGMATFFPPLRANRPNAIDVVVEWSRTGRGEWKGQSGGGCRHDLGLCEALPTQQLLFEEAA